MGMSETSVIEGRRAELPTCAVTPRLSLRHAAQLYSRITPPRRSRRSTGPIGCGTTSAHSPGRRCSIPWVRTGGVVVVNVLRHHLLQVPAAEDESHSRSGCTCSQPDERGGSPPL